MIDWAEMDYFEQKEFDDPDYPGSGEHIDFSVVYALNALREKMGCPIIVHNKFGLHGAVCMEHKGHCPDSAHYYPECSAVDFHFKTKTGRREQAKAVIEHGFGRAGVYYGQRWMDRELPISFHVDMRETFQLWKCWKGMYTYLL